MRLKKESLFAASFFVVATIKLKRVKKHVMRVSQRHMKANQLVLMRDAHFILSRENTANYINAIYTEMRKKKKEFATATFLVDVLTC